jgi:hypothetical protein
VFEVVFVPCGTLEARCSVIVSVIGLVRLVYASKSFWFTESIEIVRPGRMLGETVTAA